MEQETELVVPTRHEVRQGVIRLPKLIDDAGDRARQRFVEFFTAQIRNSHTRRAYANAVVRFLTYCDSKGWKLRELDPVRVATYIESLGGELQPASVKQHLAALRILFDYLVVGQVLPFNPASSVRGPKHVVRTGKTPVLFADDARALLDSIDTSDVVGLRDRALIAVMIYSFARVGAVVKMRVKDYYVQGRRAWFVLHEKGGRFHRVPAHHKACEYVEAYLGAAGIGDESVGPLFRSAPSGRRKLTSRPLVARNVLGMVKRRAVAAGLPADVCNHSFRATGITEYLSHDGSLEMAAQIAGHASTRTTQLYNRTNDQLTLGEIERIRI